MKYGIMGAAVPLLMEKPTFEYLCKAAPSIDSKTVKTYFKAIMNRTPSRGQRNNEQKIHNAMRCGTADSG